MAVEVEGICQQPEKVKGKFRAQRAQKLEANVMRQLRAKPAISQEDEGSLHWNSKLQVVPSNFTIQVAQFGASLQRDFAGEYADWFYWKFHQQERRTDAMGTTGSCQGVKYLLPRGSQSEVQTSQALQALLKDLGNPFIPSDLQCIVSSKSMDMSCQSLKLFRLFMILILAVQ